MVLGLWIEIVDHSKKKGAWNEVLINEYLLFNSDVLWKIDSLSIFPSTKLYQFLCGGIMYLLIFMSHFSIHTLFS